MARSRRRPMRRTSPRRRADWVYRGNDRQIGIGISVFTSLGTYDMTVHTINSGVANAQSKVLYDSQNYFALLGRGGVGTAANVSTIPQIGRVARAEGRKAVMRAVEGYLFCEPTTWSLGQVAALGMRLGAFEQDMTGVFSLDSGFSMWENEAIQPFTYVGNYANNGRQNAREWRRMWFFTDTGVPAARFFRFRWTGRRVLQPNECFGIYTELGSTSVNLRTQWWFRTLVEDEG